MHIETIWGHEIVGCVRRVSHRFRSARECCVLTVAGNEIQPVLETGGPRQGGTLESELSSCNKRKHHIFCMFEKDLQGCFISSQLLSMSVGERENIPGFHRSRDVMCFPHSIWTAPSCLGRAGYALRTRSARQFKSK